MSFYSPGYFRNPVKISRALSKEERSAHLKPSDVQTGFDENTPHYQLSVIQYNSSFLDVVDRNYPVRGIATFLSLFGMGMFGIMLSLIILPNGRNEPDPFWFVFFIIVFAVPGFAFSVWVLLKESFFVTHLPMRLNRRNGKIYVWRKNGVLVASWDKVFFFARDYMDSGSSSYDIRGNVLADDGVTVIDSFPFGGYSSADKEDIKLYFEYFRRYMEVGPEQPYRMLKVCLPIAKRRETWWEGLMRLFLNVGDWWIVQIIMLPFFFPISLTRWFAMHTSRIPQWPDWVEKECVIDPNDPFIRDSGYIAPRAK
jgi:hypothetical protein